MLLEQEKTMKNQSENSKRSLSSTTSSDLSSVSSFTSFSEKSYNESDVKEFVAEKLNKRLDDVLHGLRTFDKKNTGKVLPANLHNVLNIFCYPLTLMEFKELISQEKLDGNGCITYKSFLQNVTGQRNERDDFNRNKKKEINLLDETTEELEIRMKRKISKNLKTFIRCMWLYDPNRDELIQKHEFRAVLENVCFHLTDEQFDRLWLLYDPNMRGVLNYKDFLLKLGTRTESYKRIIPKGMKSKIIHQTNSNDASESKKERTRKKFAKLGRDDPEIQGQVFSSIVEVFRKRVEKNFPILLRTFRIKDGSDNGFVPLTVFHQVLNYFVMPMSSQLFKQVLTNFNVPTSANKIQWYEFLKSVCMKNAHNSESSTQYSKSYNWNACRSIIEKLKKAGTSSENFFSKSFTVLDQNNKRTITRAELKRAINQQLLLPLGEEEFRALMFILDPGHTNVVDCQNFLSIFESTQNEKNNNSNHSPANEDLQNERISPTLAGEKLKMEFKRSFNKNLTYIEKAINAFDSEETGFMHIDDFRKILQSFCFLLTDSQFREILGNTPVVINKINYSHFIKNYKKGSFEDEEKWALYVKKLTAFPDKVKKLEADDVIRHIKEAVKCHKDKFLQEFKEQDFCNIGIARQEVVQKLLHKYVFRLSPEQFNNLWEKLPKNEIGFLNYEEFLNEWCNNYKCDNGYRCSRPASRASQCSLASTKRSLQSTPRYNWRERPKTASSIASSKSVKSCFRPRSAASSHSSILTKSLVISGSDENSDKGNLRLEGLKYGVLTNQEYKQFRKLDFRKENPGSKSRSTNGSMSAKTCFVMHEKKDENAMKNEIMNNAFSANEANSFINSIKTRWRDILRRCKVLDTENQNTLLWKDFLSVLEKTGIYVTSAVEQLLNIQFNIKVGFPVNYWLFLKNIVLNLDNSLNTNQQIKRTASVKVNNNDVTGLSKALLTNKDKILKHYRDLRYAFRRIDKGHTGFIKSLEFRKILGLYKIQLSEEDFFYIQDYFDPKLTEQINYDAFFNSFT